MGVYFSIDRSSKLDRYRQSLAKAGSSRYASRVYGPRYSNVRDRRSHDGSKSPLNHQFKRRFWSVLHTAVDHGLEKPAMRMFQARVRWNVAIDAFGHGRGNFRCFNRHSRDYL